MSRPSTGRAALAGISLLAISLAYPAAARAQAKPVDGWRFTVGAGAYYIPDYPGSDDYKVAPAPVLRVQKDHLYLETDGPGIRANIVPHGRFEFGPVLSYGGGRDDVEDSAVDRLPDADDEFSLGAFAAYQLPGILDQRDSLRLEVEAVEAVSGDNGLVAKAGIEYGRQATERLSFGIGVSTSYVDGDYADTYFSISSAGAAASGLSVYDAGSGFRDVTLSVSGRFTVTRSIGIGAVAGISRLLGDAADSPVVEDRGDDTPLFGGAFVTYSF